jgi:hypothetical protein
MPCWSWHVGAGSRRPPRRIPIHATIRIATHYAPLFSRPTTPPNTPGVPNWHRLDLDLQQALVGLLTQMIGNHLPGSFPHDARGGADDPR